MKIPFVSFEKMHSEILIKFIQITGSFLGKRIMHLKKNLRAFAIPTIVLDAGQDWTQSF